MSDLCSEQAVSNRSHIFILIHVLLLFFIRILLQCWSVLELLHCVLKHLQDVVTGSLNLTQGLLQHLTGRLAPGLDPKVDAVLTWMWDVVAAEVDIRVLEDHVAESVAKCVVFVVQDEGTTFLIVVRFEGTHFQFVDVDVRDEVVHFGGNSWASCMSVTGTTGALSRRSA